MSNEGLSPVLVKSFSAHKGERGVHFYDSKQCEFMSWEKTLASMDKLVEAMSNYDPEKEFVTCTAGGGQLTIELFKAQFM
jgi:hypothetical protein